jgi:hypothetical protein
MLPDLAPDKLKQLSQRLAQIKATRHTKERISEDKCLAVTHRPDQQMASLEESDGEEGCSDFKGAPHPAP